MTGDVLPGEVRYSDDPAAADKLLWFLRLLYEAGLRAEAEADEPPYDKEDCGKLEA